MLKQILAGIAGIATAMIIIMGWEILIARAPGYVFIGLLAGYAIGCFGGGAVATFNCGENLYEAGNCNRGCSNDWRYYEPDGYCPIRCGLLLQVSLCMCPLPGWDIYWLNSVD